MYSRGWILEWLLYWHFIIEAPNIYCNTKDFQVLGMAPGASLNKKRKKSITNRENPVLNIAIRYIILNPLRHQGARIRFL